MIPDPSPHITSTPTRWSLVRLAVTPGDAAQQALGAILSHHWYPLYAWARRSGMTEDDAADGVQDFLHKVCATNLLAQARAERGRLRTWMLTCFQNHLRAGRRRDQAQKRGGGTPLISVDWRGAESIYLNEPALREEPDALYTRAWAVSLMEEALVKLAAHYAASGRAALHEALLPSLEQPLAEQTYADLAPALGMSPGAVCTAALRMRQRYRAILLELAGERLGITHEVALAEELRSLLRG
jgi:RNA polymerase sigma-70 factor (ECF subfamily)